MASERRRAATLGIVLAAVAAAVVIGAWFVNVWAFDRSVQLFTIGESGIVTWSSASATVAAGVIALLLSFVDPAQKVRGALLAVGLAYISFDDSVAVHERLARKIAQGLGVADYYIRVIYPIVLFPLLFAVAYLLFDLGRTDALARRFIVVGLAGLVIGVGLDSAEIALDLADVSDGSSVRVVSSGIRESAELAGWILIATGAGIRLIGLYDRRCLEGAPQPLIQSQE